MPAWARSWTPVLVNGGLAAGDPLECFADFPGADILGQVAAGPGSQCVDDRAVIGVGGEYEHFDAGVVFAKAAGGLDPIAVRHPQVHQHDVWPKRIASAGASSPSAPVPTHLDAREKPKEGAESLADHALVIGRQDADDPVHAGTHSSTRNPPSVEPAVSVPPSSSARSLMPVSP